MRFDLREGRHRSAAAFVLLVPTVDAARFLIEVNDERLGTVFYSVGPLLWPAWALFALAHAWVVWALLAARAPKLRALAPATVASGWFPGVIAAELVLTHAVVRWAETEGVRMGVGMPAQLLLR